MSTTTLALRNQCNNTTQRKNNSSEESLDSVKGSIDLSLLENAWREKSFCGKPLVLLRRHHLVDVRSSIPNICLCFSYQHLFCGSLLSKHSVIRLPPNIYMAYVRPILLKVF